MVKRKKIAIIVESGTLDRLYCAFILASTAVAMDMEAHLYFTFFGLNMLRKGAMEKAGLPATYKHLEEDLIPEIDEIAGAATFLDVASKADITLFI